MIITCTISLLLLFCFILAYRVMAAVSPGDEVPRILLGLAGLACVVFLFFSIPAIAQIATAGLALAAVRFWGIDSNYGPF